MVMHLQELSGLLSISDNVVYLRGLLNQGRSSSRLRPTKNSSKYAITAVVVMQSKPSTRLSAATMHNRMLTTTDFKT